MRNGLETHSERQPRPHSGTRPDALTLLLDSVDARRSLWGIMQLMDGGGYCAGPVYDVRFVLMLDGSGYLEACGKTILMSKGDFALLPRGSQYAMRQSKSSRAVPVDENSKADRKLGPPWVKLGKGTRLRATTICATIEVDRLRWDPAARLLPDVIHIKSADGALPYWAGPMNDLAAFNLAGLGSGAESLLCRIAEICIIQSLRAYAGQEDRGQESRWPGQFLSAEPRINAALRLIESKPGQDWSVSRLATAVGMSRSAFTDAFASHVGETPMRYLTQIRMERAGELMKFRNLSLSEIAAQVGYESEAAFARTFKRSFGVMPRTFRKSGPPPSTEA